MCLSVISKISNQLPPFLGCHQPFLPRAISRADLSLNPQHLRWPTTPSKAMCTQPQLPQDLLNCSTFNPELSRHSIYPPTPKPLLQKLRCFREERQRFLRSGIIFEAIRCRILRNISTYDQNTERASPPMLWPLEWRNPSIMSTSCCGSPAANAVAICRLRSYRKQSHQLFMFGFHFGL